MRQNSSLRIVPCNVPFKRPLKSWRRVNELLGDILRPRKTSDVQNGLQYYLFNVVGSVMTDVSVSRKPIESSASWAFPIKSGCYITHSPYLSQNVMPLKRLFVFCFVSDLLLAVVPKLCQKFVNWTGRGSQGRRGETKPSRSINVHA